MPPPPTPPPPPSPDHPRASSASALPTAVFASGGGSNFQALTEHARDRGTQASWRPVLLVSDRPGAGALRRAQALGCAAQVIDPADADALLELLRAREVGMILLAGYLRLVPPRVVEAFRGRILNIHPGLLPRFGGRGMYGRNVHEAVLASGTHETGVTIHLVDEAYDRGPPLAEVRVPVRPGDDPDTLAARVLRVEHELYPRVADHLAAALLRGEPPGPFPSPMDSELP